jgi:hypothetical protein
MIFTGDGWLVAIRNVETGKVDTLPVAFLVFVPLTDKRGAMQVQVVPLVLKNGELVAAAGKLEKAV